LEIIANKLESLSTR